MRSRTRIQVIKTSDEKINAITATATAAAKEAKQEQGKAVARARQEGKSEGLRDCQISAERSAERACAALFKAALDSAQAEAEKAHNLLAIAQEECAILKAARLSMQIKHGMQMSNLEARPPGIGTSCGAVRQLATAKAELDVTRAKVAELNSQLILAKATVSGEPRARTAAATVKQGDAICIVPLKQEGGRYPVWLLSLLCDLVVKGHVPLRNVDVVLDLCFSIHTGGCVPREGNQISKSLTGLSFSRLGHVDQVAYAARNAKDTNPVSINSDTGNKRGVAREVICVGRWNEDRKVHQTPTLHPLCSNPLPL